MVYRSVLIAVLATGCQPYLETLEIEAKAGRQLGIVFDDASVLVELGPMGWLRRSEFGSPPTVRVREAHVELPEIGEGQHLELWPFQRLSVLSACGRTLPFDAGTELVLVPSSTLEVADPCACLGEGARMTPDGLLLAPGTSCPLGSIAPNRRRHTASDGGWADAGAPDACTVHLRRAATAQPDDC